MNEEKITIHNFDTLAKHMDQNKEFTVWWTVRCDIGPEWIGSKREICFLLDGKSLSNTAFLNDLKDQLVRVANIPEKSSNHLISGEGDILLKDGKLIVEYWWTAAIPYQDSDRSGDGAGLLYT